MRAPPHEPALQGLRVLVVEDEFMIAMLIETALQDHGCVVLGPYGSVLDGLQSASKDVPDAALLDVNLHGEKVYPLAEHLEQSGIPFVLLSGYGSDAIPPGREGWRACSKPFSSDELIDALIKQIAARAQPGAG